MEPGEETQAPGAAAARRPPWLEPRAAYLHVPFCARHCCYCDFAVAAGRDELIGPYLEALETELAALGAPRAVESIFVGGGTPTHLPPSQLQGLLESIRRWLRLAPGSEFSIEANPATLDETKIQVLAEHGVNRLSLGAQSFRLEHLRMLERDHDAVKIRQALERARPFIPNLSLDLIFGVPGQTVPDWREDLRQAIELGVDHVSTYGLTYEKGTRLWKDRQAGRVTAVAEEVEREMYALAMDLLAAAGYEQYEISNFARPGRRSRHNEVYWANEAYYGFGLGAARYVNGRREVNTRDLDRYLACMKEGFAAVQQAEELGPLDRARETAAVQLRRAEGIGRRRFREQTGFELNLLLNDALRRHIVGGLLDDDGEHLRLTREGKFVADTMAAEFFR